MTPNNVYQEVKKQALPLIKNYRDDLLKHDNNLINKECPGMPFLHFTRDWGTHIIFFSPAADYPGPGEKVKYLFSYADRYHLLKSRKEVFDAIYVNFKVELVLYYDGVKVQKINKAQADKLIKEYTDKIYNQFKTGDISQIAV
ncbi:MAG: hypothetical protein GY853_15900 [PVC group bacterium]|nr:hypothetical protein [PVC group bacterium]